MKISGISKEDSVKAAQLMKIISDAKFDGVQVQDMRTVLESVGWLAVVCRDIGKIFQEEETERRAAAAVVPAPPKPEGHLAAPKKPRAKKVKADAGQSI